MPVEIRRRSGARVGRNSVDPGLQVDSSVLRHRSSAIPSGVASKAHETNTVAIKPRSKSTIKVLMAQPGAAKTGINAICISSQLMTAYVIATLRTLRPLSSAKKSFDLIVLCVLPYWQSDSKRTSKITHQNIKPGERSLDDNDRVAVAILAAMIGAEMPCKIWRAKQRFGSFVVNVRCNCLRSARISARRRRAFFFSCLRFPHLLNRGFLGEALS